MGDVEEGDQEGVQYIRSHGPTIWVPDWGEKFKNGGPVKQKVGLENSQNGLFARKMGLIFGYFCPFLVIFVT